MKLLIAEDFEPLRESLREGLEDAGYAVDATGDGEEAWWYLRGGTYDAVVLDITMPKRTGLWVLDRLRESDIDTGVIVLTARDTLDDRVDGLNRGADDYLVKPFAFPELLARLQALLRRRAGRAAPLVHAGPVTVDLVRKQARVGDEPVALTPTEFGILEALAYAAGQVVSRAALGEHLYRFDGEPDSNAVDVHLSQLRRKLADAGAPDVIVTRRGYGYLLELGNPCRH